MDNQEFYRMLLSAERKIYIIEKEIRPGHKRYWTGKVWVPFVAGEWRDGEPKGYKTIKGAKKAVERLCAKQQIIQPIQTTSIIDSDGGDVISYIGGYHWIDVMCKTCGGGIG